MPRAYLVLSPQQITEVLKTSAAGQELTWQVHNNGLPPDTICVGLQARGMEIRFVLESADFIGGETLADVELIRTPGYTDAEIERFRRVGMKAKYDDTPPA